MSFRGSNCTRQPACVQTLLYASTLFCAGRSRTAGNPPGAVNPIALPTGTLSSDAIGVPLVAGAPTEGDVVAVLPPLASDPRPGDVKVVGDPATAFAAAATKSEAAARTPPRRNSRRRRSARSAGV